MSWRRILVLSAILLLALIGATWIVLQRTGAATGLVRTALARLLRPRFELQSATVDLFRGRVTLDSLRIADPARPGIEMLQGKRVEIDVETDPAGELLSVHGFAVDGLDLDLDLTGNVAPSLDTLLTLEPSANTELRRVTPVRVERSSLRLRLDVVPETLVFSDVQLDLQQLAADDGTVDPSLGVLRGNAQLDNLGIRVQLLGDLDLTTGVCRVQARVLDLEIDAALLQRLQPLVYFALPTTAATAHLHELTLWLEVALHGDSEAVAGVSFELDGIHCSLPELPMPLRGAQLRGLASTRDGGTAQLTAQKLWPGTDPAVVAEVIAQMSNLVDRPRIEVRGKGRKVPLDAEVQGALRSFAATDAIIDGLRPTAGTADFDLFVRDPGTSDEILDLDLTLRDVALSYHGFGPPDRRVAFPLPVVHANGHVHVRDNVITIEDVVAEVAPTAGGGSVTMSGYIDLSAAGPARVTVDLFAPIVQFTPPLRAAFAELVRDRGDLYDQFQPRGALSVQLRIRPPEELPGEWQITAEPLGAEAQWSGFPLPLHDVRGQIIARSAGLQLQLTGAYREATARLSGRLLAPPDRPGAIASGVLELRVAAERVPLDDRVAQATQTLAPQTTPVWTELAPSGHSNAELRLRRASAGAPLVYDLALDLVECRMLPRSFPMPLTHVTGEVLVHGRDSDVEVQVDTLRGRLQEREGHTAELAVVGSVRTVPEFHEDLMIVIRGLDLDAELGDTLERTGAVGTGTWAVLRPSGSVDVTCRQLRTGDLPPDRRFTVLLRDARTDAEMLPRSATSISGELEVAGGVLTFNDLRGRMGATIVTCRDGRVGPSTVDGRTEVAFTVTAERLPLDDSMAKLFVGPLHQSVLDRQLRGSMSLNGLQLRFLLPSDGSDAPIETVLQGQIEALDVEMLLGTRLTEINGLVMLAESHVTRDGGAIHGNWTKGTLQMFGHPITGIQSDFVVDPERFVMRQLQGRVHGGEVHGRQPAGDSLTYQFATATAPGKLAFDLEAFGASLHEFLVHCGLTNTPYDGNAAGWMQLHELNGYDLVGMRADGELRIIDGNLGTVPVFTAIYALMAERNRPRFENLTVGFRVAERTLHLDDLTLRSPLIAVQGGGTLSLQGYLDIVLTTDTLLGGSADMLLLPPVIQMITSSLVRFHMFGFLRHLQAEQRWFAQRDPHPTRLLPVPPRLERPRQPDY